MAYQVKDWDEHFESSKSRTYDRCSFVCVPNKQHGMGFLRIVSEPDGAAVFGIWAMILQALSQQKRPRNGWLTDDGTESGRAWTVSDLSMRWRREVIEIERALGILCSPQVGWLQQLVLDEYQTDTNPIPLDPRREGKGIERKGIEEAGSNAKKPRSAPTTVDEDYLSELQGKEAYKNLNVRFVFSKMMAWCENRGKQATRLRLLNWLNREDQPVGNGSIASDKPNARCPDCHGSGFYDVTRSGITAPVKCSHSKLHSTAA